LDEVAWTKLQIDILDCTTFTVTREIRLFIASLKTLNPILTENTIRNII